MLPFLAKYKEECPYTGIQVSFTTMITATLVFVLVSLATTNKGFDLDALLNRTSKNTKPNKSEDK